jgi:hypothetical protein
MTTMACSYLEGTLRLNPAFQDMGLNANRHALRPPDLAKQHVRTTRSLLATIRHELQGACEHISESERAIARSRETLRGSVWLLRGAERKR